MSSDVLATAKEIHRELDHQPNPDAATLGRIHTLVESCKDRLVDGFSQKITHVNGNIADQTDIEAVVNAANGDLAAGGGVSGALHGAAGSALSNEASAWTSKNGRLHTGKVAVTGSGLLKNKTGGPTSVFHAATVEHLGGKTSAETVRRSMRNILIEAVRSGVRTIAIPILGAGTGGLSEQDANAAMKKGLRDRILDLPSIDEIRIVHFGNGKVAA